MPELHDLMRDAAPRPSTPVDVDALWRTGRRRRSSRRTVAVLSAVIVVLGAVGTVAALTGSTVRFADDGGDAADDSRADPDRDAEDDVSADAGGDPEGDAGDDDVAPVEPSEAASDDPYRAAPGMLRLGALLPLSGDLAYLGPGMRAAVELAVEDLNAAGGVLGQPVELVVADSADGDLAVTAAADDLLAHGVTAVVGPASGFRTADAVRKLAASGTLVLSPFTSWPSFGEGADGMVGRLRASDALEGTALAKAIVEDGATRVAVFARADDYGQYAAAELRRGLEAAGVKVVEEITYGQTGQAEAGLVEQAASSSPDAVVLLSYDEVTGFLTAMPEFNISPAEIPVWSGSGFPREGLPPTAAGVRLLRPSLPDDSAFVARLTAARPDLEETTFAAASYDATVIIALAAAAADSAAGPEIADALATVTRPGGEPCDAPATCLALLEEGTAVTYDGALGVADLGDANQPEEATFDLFRVEGDGSQTRIGTVEASAR